ncbi:hypothetical protein [Facklamia lactis]|uniref:hypothetical protein n=1 Tax=Facklamia lactis TaxID=2749967 RepID=UPI0018CD95C1|nr:hypothetical protein [Facklamia lactis]MBG9980444.1 hypothetical protein [Facklamia lactis]
MKQMIQLLKEIGLPYAYNHFGEGNAPEPPFICYLYPQTDNFSADGVVYLKKNQVNLELYTDKKAVTLEQQVESILDGNNTFYNKSEVYIESEKMYEVLYQFTLEVDYEK